MLLAEDIPENADLATLRLEGKGYQVTHVPDGGKALAEAAASPYDIILMDVQMPHMDGLEATRRIRAADIYAGRRTPIIALTASIMPEDVAHCKEAGMDRVVGKPIDFNLLFSEMEDLLASREPEPEGKDAGKKRREGDG